MILSNDEWMFLCTLQAATKLCTTPFPKLHGFFCGRAAEPQNVVGPPSVEAFLFQLSTPAMSPGQQIRPSKSPLFYPKLFILGLCRRHKADPPQDPCFF